MTWSPPCAIAVLRRGRRLLGVVLAALTVLGASVSTAPAGRAGPDGDRVSTHGFAEVDRLPLWGTPEIPDSPVKTSGWLLLDPATRRGYQVFETTVAGRLRTVLQSFDLDTLKPRRRALLAGVPITSGVDDSGTATATSFAGEVVHAFDPERGRLYLALSDTAPAGQAITVGTPPDGQRPLSRFMAVDEAAFDRCGGEQNCPFAASFREPLGDQARLHHYWVLSMTVTRHHTADGQLGRLLVLFAQPQPGGQANPSPFYDHTLAQWEAPRTRPSTRTRPWPRTTPGGTPRP